MAEFVRNPSFDMQLERGILRALDDAGDEMARKARVYISPHSSSVARNIRKDPARRSFGGPGVIVRMGKGLGPIFEFSRQQPRQTSKGWNRGVMQRRVFFNKAKDEVVRKGLSLSRYI